MRRITISTLRRMAPIGVTVTHDERPLGGTYRATAPRGYRFEKSLHELVAAWGGDLGLDGLAAEARRDLFERLTEATLERCDDPECGSCVDADAK